MSALNETTTVIAPVVDKVVKEKKPSLPAKYAKFMQFGFFFVSSMKDAGAIDDASAATLLDRLCTFSSVEQQQEFYQVWLDSAKESNKAMRKAIAAAKKAALPPKVKKPRAKKVVDPSDPSADVKPKKPRAKKSDKVNDLVDQLSALALNPTPLEIPLEVPPSEPSPIVVVTQPAEVSASIPAKKPRAKAAKKTKSSDPIVIPISVPPPPPLETKVVDKSNDEQDDDEDLDVRDFVFDGKQYLIDDSTGNIFNSETHEHIGVYTSQSQKITFI
jgi:hypothetical protein